MLQRARLIRPFGSSLRQAPLARRVDRPRI